MNTVTIFFCETDNLYKEIAKNKLIDRLEDKLFLVAEYIEVLSKRTYTNYVGYFKYLSSETIYQIYIVPKTIKYIIENKYNLIDISLNDMDEEYKLKCKDMVTSYIKDSMILLCRYNKKYKLLYGSDYIDNSLLNSDNKRVEIEDIVVEYYKFILLDIKKNVNKYYEYSNLHYIDSCKNINSSSIDVYSSIIKPDKSMIYTKQSKKISILELVYIVYNAIEIFKNSKLEYLDNKEEIKNIADSIQKIIKKKFNYKNRKIKEEKIISSITKYKFYNKKQSKLYKDLLLLLGYEELNLDYKEDINTEDLLKYKRELKDMPYILINSHNIYEYKVYEYCKEKWKSYKVKMNNKKKIIVYRYKLKDDYECRDKDSKPDILVYDDKDKVKVVVDAKWKILNDIKRDIKEEDIDKLKRDGQAWSNESVERHLIYPIVPKGSDGVNIEVLAKMGIIKLGDGVNKFREEETYNVQINECR